MREVENHNVISSEKTVKSFQNEMLDYFSLRLENIKNNYFLAVENNDPEGIHDLRVGIKRMKAFFNIIQSINRMFNAKKKSADFRNIARNTINLRDVQVQYGFIQEVKDINHCDVEDYETFLNKKEKNAAAIFHDYANKFSVRRIDRTVKLISDAIKEIATEKAELGAMEHFDKLCKKISELKSNGALKEDILHKLRKCTKETYYSLEIIQQCFHIFKDCDVFKEELKKLHQVLGRWHDHFVCLEYLNDFMKDSMMESNVEVYTEIAKYVHNQKEELSKEVNKIYDKLFQITVSF